MTDNQLLNRTIRLLQEENKLVELVSKTPFRYKFKYAHTKFNLIWNSKTMDSNSVWLRYRFSYKRYKLSYFGALKYLEKARTLSSTIDFDINRRFVYYTIKFREDDVESFTFSDLLKGISHIIGTGIMMWDHIKTIAEKEYEAEQEELERIQEEESDPNYLNDYSDYTK